MRLGEATILRADARQLPLPDNSVDLVVSSPPYWSLRSYQDGGEHYDEQIGSESTHHEFLDALLDVMRECMRVVKPSGSIFFNLGDKYSTGSSGQSGLAELGAQYRGGGHSDVKSRQRTAAVPGMRPKSLVLIPERFRIRCVDELGLICRAVIVWSKPNGLPESVTDRVRRSHEDWMHFTLEPRYFSAVDEIREPHVYPDDARHLRGGRRSVNPDGSDAGGNTSTCNPLGKLPGSVWTVPTEPLRVPDHLGVDHFAAFPTEWPKRIIQGWSPAGVCVECGEGRRPVVASVGLDMSRPQARRAHELAARAGLTEAHFKALLSVGVSDTGRGKATQDGTGKNTPEVYALAGKAREALGGYAREYLLRRPTGLVDACACGQGDDLPGTTPAVVLDPFGGTGTTAMVAKALGRHGISVDMSADYCRLAEWRTNDRDQLAKVLGVAKAEQQDEGQMDMFELLEEGA